MKRFLLALATISLLGCASKQEVYYSHAYQPRIDWPINEYSALNSRTGKNTITGQAFMQEREIITAAGKVVYLNPITSYSQQFVNAIIFQSYGKGVVLTPEKADPRINNYLLETTADSEGKFIFTNVPDGDYFLYTRVLWAQDGMAAGGFVFKRIKVTSQSQNNHVLTHIDKSNL